MRVLVIDGERHGRCALRQKLTQFLEHQGHPVVLAASGIAGQDAAADRPDIILILDLGLPELNGLEVCRQLREGSQAPVIMLSVREGEQYKIAAFELGADDFVNKPFHLGELLARMHAVLRRCGSGNTAAESQLSVGGLQIDFTRRRVTRSGEEVHLTPTEYELLRHLTLNSDQVLTHEQLLAKVWGKEHREDSHTLRVHIANLRSKIEPDPPHPQFLQTEPRIGYRFRTG